MGSRLTREGSLKQAEQGLRSDDSRCGSVNRTAKMQRSTITEPNPHGSPDPQNGSKVDFHRETHHLVVLHGQPAELQAARVWGRERHASMLQ